MYTENTDHNRQAHTFSLPVKKRSQTPHKIERSKQAPLELDRLSLQCHFPAQKQKPDQPTSKPTCSFQVLFRFLPCLQYNTRKLAMGLGVT